VLNPYLDHVKTEQFGMKSQILARLVLLRPKAFRDKGAFNDRPKKYSKLAKSTRG
jgi:hypothetical protein